MAYDRKDHYYRRAKAEGKASRAAYKISQLHRQFHLFRRGDKVVDLGCAPGGWLQEVSTFVGPQGKVVGVDLLPLKIVLPKNVTFIPGDLRTPGVTTAIHERLGGEADVVLSDMAPNTTGVAFTDAYRSFELAKFAFEACQRLLKDDGKFVVKIFTGDEVKVFRQTLAECFTTVQIVTPPATRKGSFEIYIVATGYKQR
ncbi:MAG: RlmE family RNA methyltransferase [Deltaproteobacteria bacterium]|nr:RlmE family RNA methyltransferase [Deltaproteobacteria bacterium]